MKITDRSDLWWKTSVVYCLDVETYMDWNDDGAGDFEGLANRALSEDHPLTGVSCSRTGATGAGPPMRCRRCSGSPRRSIWCRSTARKRQCRPG